MHLKIVGQNITHLHCVISENECCYSVSNHWILKSDISPYPYPCMWLTSRYPS